ncbi:MAG: dipeptidyl-peptidase 3 family protein [Gemmatimonadales bacterium]
MAPLRSRLGTLLVLALLAACQRTQTPAAGTDESGMRKALAQYVPVRLTADLAPLTEKERQLIPPLIAAARAMDQIFWQETFGNGDSLMAALKDSWLRRYVEINRGPWDRLANEQPFVPGIGAKPKGAGFYPTDLTSAEFEAAVAESPARGTALKSLYTVVRRDAVGKLTTVPYHEAFADPVRYAAAHLREAALLAEDPGLKRYLELRAAALENDDYQASDLAWMDMKSNTIDIVIGPIETYEDHLFGYKAAHEAYVLIKDQEWSRRLARYAALLPALQRGLPVPAEFKREKPGTDSDLNAYDAVFCAGQANAGVKTIAINLPNDEQVQLRKGTRRLQLKNVMRAKYDQILIPIADLFIAPDQRAQLGFDAFFQNVMFHEVAHGLGIKQTINRRGTVRSALKERASALEEEKADVLGLYLVGQLKAQGELGDAELLANYVTFLAGIVRSVRFGGSDAHGRANMSEFNFLIDHGAFTRDEPSGTYRVDPEKMKAGIDELAGQILRLQGNGDYDGTGAFLDATAKIGPALQSDLDRLAPKGIPVDIVFEQGEEALGLPPAR